MRVSPWIPLFISAVFIAPQVNAQDFSNVALSMKDLVRNGSFNGAMEGWMTSGESMSVAIDGGARIRLSAPRNSVGGARVIYQNLPQGIAKNHTLYLRFKASGDVRIGVQLRETKNVAKKLILTSVARPGDDVTGAPKQYAYAVKVDRTYQAEELQLAFSFGNDPGQVFLSNVEIYDQDFTPLSALPQTGATTPVVPATPAPPVANPLPTLGAAPKPQPVVEPVVENNVAFLKAPTTPALAPPVALIENGDFAQADKNWTAWGQNVGADMKDGVLVLKLDNAAGSKAWDAGLSQPIKESVKRGDTVSVRLKVKGNVRVVVHVQEPKAPFRSVVSRSFQAKPEGEEVLLVGRADADWNANDLQFEVQMGEDKGELEISKIQVTKQSQ